MNKNSRILFWLLLCAAQSTLSQKAERAYETGYFEEVVEGNLLQAIVQYENCLAEAGQNRALQAKAHFRIAICYEALGKPESTKHYRAIVDRFADQVELFGLAKDKLSTAVTMTDVPPLVRYYLERMNITPGYRESYDHRWLAYTDWDTGHLMLEDRSTRRTIVLTKSDSMREERFAGAPVWSRDNQVLLYSYHWGSNSRALCAVDITSKKTRTIYSHLDHVAIPLDISPVDSLILCRIIDFKNSRDEAGSLVFIDPKSGVIRSIQHLDANARGLTFSPQGDAIVFDTALDADNTGDLFDRDIYVMRLNDYRLIRLTGEKLTNCNNPIWGPDGRSVIYQSATRGNSGLWSIAVDPANREAAGNPVQLTANLHELILQQVKVSDPLSHHEKLPWEDPSSHRHVDDRCFADEFDQPVLNEAWQVFEWKGPSIYKFKQFGRFTLIDNPGRLRYYLTPASLAPNYLHNFIPVYDHWCNWFYPSLEIMRPFAGEEWVLSSQVTYHMVDGANGRGFSILLYFGPEIDTKTALLIERYKEFSLRPADASEMFIRFTDKGEIVAEKARIISPRDTIGISQFTYHFQIIRRKANIRVLLSDDGRNFQEVFSCRLPERILQYQQWSSLSGVSWFNPARSYADWDYVRLEPLPLQP